MQRHARPNGRFMFAHADIVFADRKHKRRLLRVRVRRETAAMRVIDFFGRTS